MQQSNELVSIIMAAYNVEKTIRQAIDSVLAQTYSNFELLVINDCSTDATQRIVKEYVEADTRVKLLNNPRNMGVSHTRLNGLKAASGNWIAVLDSDDAWLPEKLEKQFDLQKKTGAVLLYTGSQFINAEGKSLDWTLHVPQQLTYKKLLKQNVLSNSSSLCQKALFEKYYTIGDQMHEDFALWLSILRDGNSAYGVDEPLLIYRLSVNSKSGNKMKAARMNWETYKAMGLNSVSAFYYMIRYAINGVLKYSHLK